MSLPVTGCRFSTSLETSGSDASGRLEVWGEEEGWRGEELAFGWEDEAAEGCGEWLGDRDLASGGPNLSSAVSPLVWNEGNVCY